ncbi:MAG: hypothetical protein FJ040_04880 [Chloroflexi bacterium]|nr:hypothetical protein [Chloroflexota bacterium]
MKQQPDYPDDFISSAGVPTIPLKAQPQRVIDVWVIAVTIVVLCIIAIIGGERVAAFLYNFPQMSLLCAVSGVLACVIGVAAKARVAVFFGLILVGTSLSILLFDVLHTIAIPLFFVASLVTYHLYAVRFLFIRERWPALLAVIAGVASVCEILYIGAILQPILVLPLTLFAATVILVNEIRRTKKKRS